MTVHLVGAGPGDPGLLTVRGDALLRSAEVVVHDRLSDPGLLDLAPPSALRIDVGKRPGGPVQQDEINALLVEHARAGRRVVRLKGGDPFVFGRGGEEALALAAAGIAFEVVPGITSAVAAPAYAGVPLTHRGLATSFTVVTGHTRHAVDSEIDWDALARAGDTIVVLMGVAHRREIAARLIDGGLDPSTPVCAVTWGTRPDQRSVRTTLSALGDALVDPPATIVIGAVAGLDLAWFERLPLFGCSVAVTRPAAQAGELATPLRELGAEVVVAPAIEVVDPADGGDALRTAATVVAEYDWVVFTSVNAVDRFVAALRDARSFGGAHVAAIGPVTASALRARGVVADLVADRYVSEGLLEAFTGIGVEPGRALVPRAAVARDAVPDGLRREGWTVDVVDAYRTVPAPLADEDLARACAARVVTFASSSAVDAFVDAAGGPQRIEAAVVTIGPATSHTARAAGLTVTAEAREHTAAGLVTAVVSAVAP